jgi:hypothetical protein
MFAAMRMIANEQIVHQVISIFQNPDQLPAFEGWLWVKNIWMPDSPFSSTMPDINTIRQLQHRSTILPLQPDCHEVTSIDGMQLLLQQQPHWVMKAPWSGAGRGLRWVHGRLTDIDRQWLLKTVNQQRCIIAEPNRSEAGDRSGASPSSVADVALEYRNGHFDGYSFSAPAAACTKKT